jgi:hypothetical protein
VATVVVVSETDPTRAGIVYKVELPDWAFDLWWKNNKELLQARNQEWGFLQKGTFDGANCTFTILREGKSVEVHVFRMTTTALSNALADADYNYPEEGGKPGRPEKRVLVSTTSKERRKGVPLTRTAFY